MNIRGWSSSWRIEFVRKYWRYFWFNELISWIHAVLFVWVIPCLALFFLNLIKIYHKKSLSFVFGSHRNNKNSNWNDNMWKKLVDFYQYQHQLPQKVIWCYYHNSFKIFTLYEIRIFNRYRNYQQKCPDKKA